MTKKNEQDFDEAEEWHICGKAYCEDDVRVRDHCHVTGKYRGSPHQSCNVNFRLTDKIPVVFHNLRGYDSHFIMQQIGEIAKKHTFKNKKGQERQMDINVIPNNMNSSLERLVGNLPDEAFKYTSGEFSEKMTFMKWKGIYPYDLDR